MATAARCGGDVTSPWVTLSTLRVLFIQTYTHSLTAIVNGPVTDCRCKGLLWLEIPLPLLTATSEHLFLVNLHPSLRGCKKKTWYLVSLNLALSEFFSFFVRAYWLTLFNLFPIGKPVVFGLFKLVSWEELCFILINRVSNNSCRII